MAEKGEGVEVFIESVGGVATFLRFMGNLWDVLGFR
jgi:hypothetical protein